MLSRIKKIIRKQKRKPVYDPRVRLGDIQQIYLLIKTFIPQHDSTWALDVALNNINLRNRLPPELWIMIRKHLKYEHWKLSVYYNNIKTELGFTFALDNNIKHILKELSKNMPLSKEFQVTYHPVSSYDYISRLWLID